MRLGLLSSGLGIARRCLRKNVSLNRSCRRSVSGGGSPLDVSIDSKTGIAVLSMNKAPVNSLNLEYLTELNIALEKVENDKHCKGLIITSSLPKIFCGGLDIMEMYQPDLDRLQEFWRTLQDMWIKLYGLNQPTIAAINGHSPAGGCLISTCCDFRIMAPNFTIGLNETQLGIVAPFWFVDTMLNTVGFRQTEMALQLGSLFKTDEALKIGLIDKIIPQEEVVTAAQQEMQKWLKIPSFARQLSKTEIRRPTIEKLLQRKEEDIRHFRDYITKESIQRSLGMYLDNLKNKKK
ncbi:enoyl-CoA delta isomerase 1, mitochondrial-like [Ostrea edulis]|uniref:enoyl-CoA delta isomerase 1, mitochondrial-like n=1 Tax=Ostrea edulis TaxID=37623 RepID=UPI0024AFF846|nr:enoyl-CoA delta isomerase 1, mitochondrial-like [Ostrea edulis]